MDSNSDLADAVFVTNLLVLIVERSVTATDLCATNSRVEMFRVLCVLDCTACSRKCHRDRWPHQASLTLENTLTLQ